MKASMKCVELIKKFEGFSSTPYLCPAGVPTIGYGSTRYEDGRVVSLSDTPISESQAMRIIFSVLVTYENAVLRYVQVPINQHEFDALVSFAYNLGAKALLGSTLLRKLNLSDYTGAALQFDEWVYAGKKKLRGLVARRKAERELFEAVI